MKTNAKTKHKVKLLELQKYLPNVADQGNCGSCWAFSMASWLTTLYNNYKAITKPKEYKKVDDIVSPQFIMDCLSTEIAAKLKFNLIGDSNNDCKGGNRKDIVALIIAMNAEKYKFPLHLNYGYRNYDINTGLNKKKPEKCLEYLGKSKTDEGNGYLDFQEIIKGMVDTQDLSSWKNEEFYEKFWLYPGYSISFDISDRKYPHLVTFYKNGYLTDDACKKMKFPVDIEFSFGVILKLIMIVNFSF